LRRSRDCSFLSIRSASASRRGRGEDGIAARLESLPAVHHVDAGHSLASDAAGQDEAAVLAPQRVVVRFQRRRGGAEQGHRTLQARAHHGHVAAVVARALVLLVGGLVLLVHDHEPHLRERREDRGARADGDAGVPFAQAPPLVVTLAHGQLAVEDGDDFAQAPTAARTSSGVSAISGTRSSALRPCSRVRSMARK
jgi:hypothetical protein